MLLNRSYARVEHSVCRLEQQRTEKCIQSKDTNVRVEHLQSNAKMRECVVNGSVCRAEKNRVLLLAYRANLNKNTREERCRMQINAKILVRTIQYICRAEKNT